MPKLIKLAKKIGLVLSKTQIQPAHLKTRENLNYLKEKIFFCWCRIIAFNNTYDQECPSIFNKKIND
jgi:hypothetical protein